LQRFGKSNYALQLKVNLKDTSVAMSA